MLINPLYTKTKFYILHFGIVKFASKHPKNILTFHQAAKVLHSALHLPAPQPGRYSRCHQSQACLQGLRNAQTGLVRGHRLT